MAIGYNALYFNTSGSFNTAIGDSALYYNTTGSNNIAAGVDALFENTTGSDNVANGDAALTYNTNGSGNAANGAYALFSLASGDYNTADGALAFESLASGSFNISLGYAAGYNVTKGDNNIEIGNEGNSDDTAIIRIGTEGVQSATYLTGDVYGDSFNTTSDRNAKENFTAVNARDVLARVSALPVTQWNYKKDSKDVQHVGPMAQDFQAAFQLSADDKHISVVDEGGVALAAIQGLNQKLEETQQAVKAKDGEIQTLKQQNEFLAERLNELEGTVRQLAARK